MKRSYLYLSEFHVGDKFTTLSRTCLLYTSDAADE